MRSFNYIEVKQPIGVFYLCSIPASILLKVLESKSRKYSEEGVQREKVRERIISIGKYCSDPDAVFPTPIVVSINSNAHSKVILDESNKTISIPDDEIIGDVIDGQHRLWGIEESKCVNSFELPVVFMFNLTVEEKAYVFSTINSNQKKVDSSLLYDLFDVSLLRSPNKTVHEIARTMNFSTDSPFYNRLKMLGRKESKQLNATLSQGTFAKSLLMLISRNPDEDARAIKRGEELKPDNNLPFRHFFIEDQDEIISRILLNCFNALKEVFRKEWEEPATNILWKTTGFRGVIYALPTVINRGLRQRELDQTYFVNCFKIFKTYLTNHNISVTSESFSGGGEQNQKRFATYLANSLMNIDLVDYKNHLKLFHDVDDFVLMIDANKYELFDIAYALKVGKTLYSTINIEESDDEIIITHPCSDSSLNIEVNTKEKVLQHIEDTYMNHMDPDTWLGYVEAVEKDD